MVLSNNNIKVKILLQRLWEQEVDWDDLVPDPIYENWLQWRSELHLLFNKHISRYYFNKKSQVASIQLHGFSDTSENAYAAVVYLRMTDTSGKVQISLVTSKTKVAPILYHYVEPTSWHNCSTMSKIFLMFPLMMCMPGLIAPLF